MRRMHGDEARATGEAPRSHRYDGAFYARLIDPLNAPLWERVAREVEPGDRVVDVGCGTGALAVRLAAVAAEVVGVELSPAMVAYAQRRANLPRNVTFLLGDAATAVSSRPDRAFELATIVMVLHEVPPDARPGVLREATRVARRVVCVDYRVPLPFGLAGLFFRGLELAAGGEHLRGFRDFVRHGGVPAIANRVGLSCRHLRHLGSALEMTELRR